MPSRLRWDVLGPEDSARWCKWHRHVSEAGEALRTMTAITGPCRRGRDSGEVQRVEMLEGDGLPGVRQSVAAIGGRLDLAVP